MFLTKYHKLLFDEQQDREKMLQTVKDEFHAITFKQQNNEKVIENSLRLIKECMCILNQDYKATKPLSISVKGKVEWGDQQFEEKLLTLRNADGKLSRKLMNEWVDKSFNLAIRELGEVELFEEKLHEFIMNGGYEQLSIFDEELSNSY